jgi:predicted outer membrane repeat protein
MSVADTTFSENQAETYGGAMLVTGEHSTLTVVDSAFLMNSSGSTGGAIEVRQGSATISSSTFFENQADYMGGAIASANYCDLIISESTFSENQSQTGGAIGIGRQVDSTISNCLFKANTASGIGAAIVIPGGDMTIANCTLTKNSSGDNGTIAMYEDEDSFPHLYAFNLIIWGNTGTPFRIRDGRIEVKYSDIEGSPPAEYNISVDPLFVDPDADDFHLQPGSPCIDAANGDEAPEYDMEGNPRCDDTDTPNTGVGSPGYADMGAYEYQP